MSIVREALEKSAQGNPRRVDQETTTTTTREDTHYAPSVTHIHAGGQPAAAGKSDGFASGFGKGLGQGMAGLGLTLGTAGVLYGLHRARQAKAHSGFHSMVGHAGHEFHSLDAGDKKKAQVYHAAIAKHSPTVAMDPIASWNHVSHFLRHPTTYQPQTIEQLRNVETSGPRIAQPVRL